MSTTPCASCQTPSESTCHHCRVPLCPNHVWRSTLAADALFGPFLVPRGTIICAPCYGERLWLAWRGLVAVITLVSSLVGAINGQIWVIPVAMLVALVWWGISAAPLKRYQAERNARDQGRSGDR